MESGSVINPRVKKFPTSEMANVCEEDIISSKLPEALISHILSFLPTIDAVRTCILSKRWIHRWTSITKLDFNDAVSYGLEYSWKNIELEITKKNLHFEKFVSRVLFLVSSIENFSLAIYSKHDVSLLNTWISNTLIRGAKNLRIHSPYSKLLFFALTSHYLFNSALLEELELELQISSTIKFPTISVHFGHLKLLKLNGIFFDIDPSNDYLTLSLPVLKKFEIKNCTWSMGKCVIVEAPLLETISIKQYLNRFAFHDPSATIKFYAMHLKEFTYCGYDVSEKISLSDNSFLSHASVEVILKQNRRKARCLAFLLQQFHQVKCIKFEGFEVMRQADIPVFSMLSHLELDMVTVEVLLGLLQKSPALKTLVLKETPSFKRELLNSDVVPECLASTLEVVKFEQVDVNKHELFLAEFFMKHGMMLERMCFSLASHRLGNTKVVKKFKEKLYAFEKGFSSSIVEFSHD